MRWAATRGMPIHRVPGSGKSSVYAFPDALDAWFSRSEDVAVAPSGTDAPATAEKPPPLEPGAPADPAPKSPPWARRIAVLAAFAALVIIAVVAVRHRLFPSADAHAIGFSNPAAEAAYLQATLDWNMRSPESLNRAIAEYGTAIARDPGVAASYAGLANTYILLRQYGLMRDAEAYAHATAAARTAAMLAPDSMEAHRALAFIAYWHLGDRSAARREFGRALALAPRDALTRHWFANALSANGEFDAALEQIGIARSLDPTSVPIASHQGLMLYLDGRRDEGKAMLQNVARTVPDDASAHRALADIALFEERPADYLLESARVFALRGDARDAAALQRIVQRLPADRTAGMRMAAAADRLVTATSSASDAFEIARVAALSGDRDATEAALRQACAISKPEAARAAGDLFLSRSIPQDEVHRICGYESLIR